MQIPRVFSSDFVISRASRRCGKSRNPAMAEGRRRRHPRTAPRRVFRDFGKSGRSPEIDEKTVTDF
jgi:hypothetical protein